MADHVESTITVKASPAAVMAVIADLAQYPSWSGPVENVEVLDVTPAGRPGRVRFHIKAFLGKEEYVLAYTWVSPESVTWTLVEGKSLTSMDGSYTLRDLGDGTTSVAYELTMELKAKIPGPLRKKAEESMVTAALKDLKQRVEQ